MSGYIDLHLHFVPGIDDGVDTAEDGAALLAGLRSLGFAKCVTTPHIRTGMFDNRPDGLRTAFDAFVKEFHDPSAHPEVDLAAEHFLDDVLWRLLEEGRVLPYPGKRRAMLFELSRRALPLKLADRFFRARIKGYFPVLAHPERYKPLFRKTAPIEDCLNAGLWLQLDLLSLVGRYGLRPRWAAERMLEEGHYRIACTDAHKPKDLPVIEKALTALDKRVGRAEMERLLVEGPASLLRTEA